MTVSATHEHGGAVLRVVFANGKGNVLDTATCDALRGTLAEAQLDPRLACVVLEGEGRHFSFGASVPEHAPDRVAEMLPRFHALIRDLVDFPAPLVALIRGQCLGGGLELAAACSFLLATDDARFGQPEIQLGVFAPAGSVLLPLRVAPAVAEDLLLTGRSIDATEAHRLGLVAAVVEGEDGLQAWLGRHIVPRSAAALRFALKASRSGMRDAVKRRLAWVEQLYLEELMQTHDAAEGIAAFLERREPAWTHQ